MRVFISSGDRWYPCSRILSANFAMTGCFLWVVIKVFCTFGSPHNEINNFVSSVSKFGFLGESERNWFESNLVEIYSTYTKQTIIFRFYVRLFEIKIDYLACGFFIPPPINTLLFDIHISRLCRLTLFFIIFFIQPRLSVTYMTHVHACTESHKRTCNYRSACLCLCG